MIGKMTMKRAIVPTIFCTFVALSGCTNQPEESAPVRGGERADVAPNEQEMEERVDSETANSERSVERVGDVLPFPVPPMGGKVGPTMQESVHKWRETPSHLPEDAPNILIVMLDDVGFGQASTFGGEIETPTLSRLAKEGIAYNRFHTTAMCSPTRAALITGRNQHRVGSGQVAEFANDWDGYTGVIPKSSATIAEVLRHYGYATAAFG